jgi:hypothetical protein
VKGPGFVGISLLPCPKIVKSPVQAFIQRHLVEIRLCNHACLLEYSRRNLSIKVLLRPQQEYLPSVEITADLGFRVHLAQEIAARTDWPAIVVFPPIFL